MGQYYYIVNLDKKQYLDPHAFGHGMKLLEFSCSQGGANTALACLLANSNGRGGGDLHSENPIVGSWAGDRIVVAGDYAEIGDRGELDDNENLYGKCSKGTFENISYKIMVALADDHYIYKELEATAVSYKEWNDEHADRILCALAESQTAIRKEEARQDNKVSV
jgi:hypothetical protein